MNTFFKVRTAESDTDLVVICFQSSSLISFSKKKNVNSKTNIDVVKLFFNIAKKVDFHENESQRLYWVFFTLYHDIWYSSFLNDLNYSLCKCFRNNLVSDLGRKSDIIFWIAGRKTYYVFLESVIRLYNAHWFQRVDKTLG